MARVPLPRPDTISRHRAVSKQAPKLVTNKSFTFWQRRTRTRKPKRVLTAGDRLVQTKKRQQHRREYQDALEGAQATIRELAEGLKNRFGKYNVDHYFNNLIHRAHTSRSVRKVSGWNAYQKLELERMKSKLATISIVDSLTRAIPGEAGNDAPKINLTEVNKKISEKWKALSPEQRNDITAEWIQKIEEQREGKKLVAHSVPLNAFHDARSTIQSIETQVRQSRFIVLRILMFPSWHSCTRGLALNSCWWPVGLPQRTSQSLLHTSQVIRLKDSLARR